MFGENVPAEQEILLGRSFAFTSFPIVLCLSRHLLRGSKQWAPQCSTGTNIKVLVVTSYTMCYACWFIYLGFVFFKCAVSSLLQLHQMSTSYCFSLIPLWINVPIEPFSAVFVLFHMWFSWLICEIPSREKKWQSACEFQLHIYSAGRLERLERHHNLPRYQ